MGVKGNASEELETNNFAFRANEPAYMCQGIGFDATGGRIRLLKFTAATCEIEF